MRLHVVIIKSPLTIIPWLTLSLYKLPDVNKKNITWELEMKYIKLIIDDKTIIDVSPSLRLHNLIVTTRNQ